MKLDLRLDELETQQIENRYFDFVDILPIETIHMLQNFGDSDQDDCKFVQEVIQGILKDKIHSLQLQSTTETFKNTKKEILSPTEMQLIEDIFNRRLQYSSQIVNDCRKVSFKKHIVWAIKNINKNLD